MPRRIPTKTKVIRFKTKNPFMRTSEIAKKMGYHRSYVHKVLKENGIITKIPRISMIRLSVNSNIFFSVFSIKLYLDR